jgi:hypothetical protein
MVNVQQEASRRGEHRGAAGIPGAVHAQRRHEWMGGSSTRKIQEQADSANRAHVND